MKRWRKLRRGRRDEGEGDEGEADEKDEVNDEDTRKRKQVERVSPLEQATPQFVYPASGRGLVIQQKRLT